MLSIMEFVGDKMYLCIEIKNMIGKLVSEGNTPTHPLLLSYIKILMYNLLIFVNLLSFYADLLLFCTDCIHPLCYYL